MEMKVVKRLAHYSGRAQARWHLNIFAYQSGQVSYTLIWPFVYVITYINTHATSTCLLGDANYYQDPPINSARLHTTTLKLILQCIKGVPRMAEANHVCPVEFLFVVGNKEVDSEPALTFGVFGVIEGG
jgi:hypothetical protein